MIKTLKFIHLVSEVKGFKEIILWNWKGVNLDSLKQSLSEVTLTHPGYDSPLPCFYLEMFDLPSADFIKEYMVNSMSK